ncbi:pyridoxal-phosphate dependent enzyme [Candidatus Saccharibacteria bacterium]|nr:pyridoxal-phosphate dependent enzyme [Candidatus Saccharibacteria bacterium]
MADNVFSGDGAILDYLDPGSGPPTPLIELPADLNPFKTDGVRIYAKLMHALPLLNVKSIPVFNMLNEAGRRGALADVHSLVENSSGNTVFSLGVVGNLLGIKNTKAFVSHEITDGKLKLLRLFGVSPVVNEEPICPDPSDKTSGVYKAKMMGEGEGWFNPGQYTNADNPAAHEEQTGRQIWEQTKGKIGVFCAGLGTAGTMAGSGGYLKRKNARIINVGVVRPPNNPVPGVRTANLLRQVAFDWQSVTDSLQSVGTIDSYEYSLRLIRRGILAGPSSGFNLKGLLKYLGELSGAGELDRVRGEDGEVVAVFITCDTPFPYIDEYFEYLEPADFPKVENEELLIDAGAGAGSRSLSLLGTPAGEKTVLEAYSDIFDESPDSLWEKINNGGTVSLNENVAVIDVRKANDFDHFHVPGALNMETGFIEDNLGYLAQKYKRHKVFVFCYRGNLSQTAAALLKSKDVDSYSVSGGTVAWSEKNLPRQRPGVCKVRHSGP